MSYVTLGSAPANEKCAQLGTLGYGDRVRLECEAFIAQLKRVLSAAGKEPPKGFRLAMKGNAHDFGTYYEVAAFFNDDGFVEGEGGPGEELAYWLDHNLPEEWDAEARAALGLGEVLP